MAVMPNVYQLGDLVRVKTGDGTPIGRPSKDAKGKNGKILRRYTASTQRLATIWRVGFGQGTPEPIAEDWLEPDLND